MHGRYRIPSVQRVGETLATDANNPIRRPESRAVSAALLARLDRRRALPRLRVLALDPRTDESFSTLLLNSHLGDIDVTRVLMRADPISAKAVLNAQADDPARRSERRLEAARRLAELDPAQGAAALARVAQAPSISRDVRLGGLHELAKTSPAQALEVAHSLATHSDLAVHVALAVSEFAPDQALDDVACLAAHPALDSRDRIALAARWALLRPEAHQPAIMLTSLAMDPSASQEDRLSALFELAEINFPRALPLLQSLAESPDFDIFIRARAAELLGRRQPRRAGPILASLRDVSGIEPSLAADLFTVWVEISAQDSVPALASYIRDIASAPATSDDRSLRERYLPKLVELLRHVDQARATEELDVLIHEPGYGILRAEAERLWAAVDPERCAGHHAAVARGQHETRPGMEGFWEAKRGSALLALARMGDDRCLELAEGILQASHQGTRSDAELVRYAVMATAELDQDRGAELMAGFALDSRLDPMIRLEFALDLEWVSESQYASVYGAFVRDNEMRQLLASFGGPQVSRIQSREMINNLIQDTRTRANTIEQLLYHDPAQALSILMELAQSSQQEESQWAYQRLSEALEALEVTHSSQ